MIRIAVYASSCRLGRRDHKSTWVVSRRDIQVPSFRATATNQHIGTIVAPEGTAFHCRPPALPKLKVPNSGGEFRLMSANEAAEAAVEGEQGLAWESASVGLTASLVVFDEWPHAEAAS